MVEKGVVEVEGRVEGESEGSSKRLRTGSRHCGHLLQDRPQCKDLPSAAAEGATGAGEHAEVLFGAVDPGRQPDLGPRPGIIAPATLPGLPCPYEEPPRQVGECAAARIQSWVIRETAPII